MLNHKSFNHINTKRHWPVTSECCLGMVERGVRSADVRRLSPTKPLRWPLPNCSGEGTPVLLASQPYARTYCADHLRVKLVVYLMYWMIVLIPFWILIEFLHSSQIHYLTRKGQRTVAEMVPSVNNLSWTAN